MNIKDIKNKGSGCLIAQVTGTISDVKERKTGEGKNGPWSRQSFKLTEGRDWMFCTAWNIKDISGCEGHDYAFLSDENGKGIKVVDNVNNGKTYKNLEVSKVEPVDPSQAPQSTPATSEPEQTTQTTRPAPAVKNVDLATVQADAAKAMMLALGVAFQVKAEAGPLVSCEDANTWARQFIINWERSGALASMVEQVTYEDAAIRVGQLAGQLEVNEEPIH